MSTPRNAGIPRDNWLLAALPEEERERIDPFLFHTHFAVKQVVFEADQPIDQVYFPITGVLSLVTQPMRDGQIIEVATVGNEGMVGLPVFLGATTAPVRCFCQVAGDAWRMAVGDFREEITLQDRLRELLNLYVQALFNQIAQAGACNRAHSVVERGARWILMTHDRIGEDQFPLRSEFLGQMLGVQPPAISLAMDQLQNAGYLRYEDGVITILDRTRLERASCECYEIIRKELDRLLPRERRSSIPGAVDAPARKNLRDL